MPNFSGAPRGGDPGAPAPGWTIEPADPSAFDLFGPELDNPILDSILWFFAQNLARLRPWYRAEFLQFLVMAGRPRPLELILKQWPGATRVEYRALDFLNEYPECSVYITDGIHVLPHPIAPAPPEIRAQIRAILARAGLRSARARRRTIEHLNVYGFSLEFGRQARILDPFIDAYERGLFKSSPKIGYRSDS